MSSSLYPIARQLLNEGRTAQATEILHAALKLNPADIDSHNLIEGHGLSNNFGTAFGICAQIHPNDEIFRFFANHPSSRNPIRDYLADGWRTLAELMRLSEHIGLRLSACNAFLEFASGYGRFTRHLVKALPAGHLHVSDVMPGSVDFLRDQLHVNGFYSSTDPKQVRFERRFEVIFVLSLFSHLPDSAWLPWLQRLYDALEPGGHLIISTHGTRSAQLAGVTLSEHGYAFFAESESSTLDGQVYGCTYTADPYVRRQVNALHPQARLTHFPAHFWDNQDAYVISRT